jgi:hypothetical protein
MTTLPFATLLCVDWAKGPRKRRAFVADVPARVVRPLPSDGLTLDHLLEVAARLPGPVLVGIDAAIGVPAAYFARATAEVAAFRGARDFPTWLARAVDHPGFLDTVHDAAGWRPDRPFFAVPAGAGALRAFQAAAGVPLIRAIDRAAGAKPPFVVAGIPGTVGSGTRALWALLAPRLAGRGFHLWPFDGPLGACARRVAIAEIYPRLAYGLALGEAAPFAMRPLAKTIAGVRSAAVARLLATAWVARAGVRFEGLEAAMTGPLAEDDFDAMMAAAALLRASLEGLALERPTPPDVAIEGDLLGAGCVALG